MSKPTAYLLIRDLPHYRQAAFVEGLAAVGYTVSLRPPAGVIRSGDALVIWNRYGVSDAAAKRFERDGNLVFVVENGYVDIPGVKKVFAVAIGGHNGLGRFPLSVERSAMLPEPQPWRDCLLGDALLLPQRGIGVPGVAMPNGWLTSVQNRLRQAGFKGRIRTRPHPGGLRESKPFEDDLDGVAFAVTWGSGAGLKALLAGVPVLHELHGWIGSLGSSEGVRHWPDPQRCGRRHMLDLVASAQWTVNEVESGAAFEALLRFHGDGRVLKRVRGDR